MNVIKVALCDDFQDLVKSYKEYIELEPDIVVPAVFYSGKECVENIANVDADMLLLDIQMETKTAGIDIIPEIRQLKPNMKIVMLTSYNDDEYIFNAFTNGASNYVLKDEPFDVILKAVRNIHNDEVVLSNQIATRLLNKANKIHEQQQSLLFLFNKLHHLTKTEFEVLEALYNGLSYSEVAHLRVVEDNTIRKIASNILHKFDEKNMQDLLATIKETGLFQYFK
jgi:DNA-binding NarL/FixJ family response regulator